MAKMMSCALLSLAIFVALVHGKAAYRDLLPNAGAMPADGLKCRQLGHNDCKIGNATNNNFAKHFAKVGYKYTPEFCRLDSDGDGVRNGAELGDPCCVWKVGDTPARTNDLSHPGEKDSMPKMEANRACPGGVTGPLTPTGISHALITVPPPPSASPSPESKAVARAAGGGVCFPGDATVVLDNGEVIAMEKLEIGHRVQVGVNLYSSVVMFTHSLPDTVHSFVRLTTVSGKTIRATEGHYIYADGKLTRMGDVVVGNLLEAADSSGSVNEKVVTIMRETGRGLYNPQTAHGDIIVDGIRASTYTHTVPTKAAHALLAPVRAAFEWTGVQINALEKIVW